MLILTCALLLFGCATTMSLSPANAKRIHTVYVNPKVTTPKEMYYMGSGFGFLFGGIGGAVQAAANQSPGERMALFARQHGIYIERIVQDEVIQQLKAKTAFRVTNSKQADATINLKIKTYGLSVPTTFSTGVKPMIDIEANMVDRQNQMIWANSDSVLPLSPGMPEYSTKAIGKNPQLLKKMWEAAAGKSVSNIVESL